MSESSISGDEGEDSPKLSTHALAALQEFYSEQQAALLDRETPISEDWQLSQFWYDEDTAAKLADEAIRVSLNKRIACISCPTLYSKLLKVQSPTHHSVLLEYDTRFQQLPGGNFVHYDYREPLTLPESLEEASFDLVVADPPFLSEECLSKTAETIKFLSRDKVILCTGATMATLAEELLGVRECSSFTPGHTRNLANQFKCFVNYESSFPQKARV